MFLSRFEVENFMSHERTAIDLYPITGLVGANNSGKSAMFDALVIFSMVSRGKLAVAFAQSGPYSYEFRRRRGASKSARMRFHAEFRNASDGDRQMAYEVAFGFSRDVPVVYTERLTVDDEVIFDRDRGVNMLGAAGEAVSDDRTLFSALRASRMADGTDIADSFVKDVAIGVSRFSKYRLDPSNLSKPARMPETVPEPQDDQMTPRLSYHGEGLAAVLYYLSEIGSPRFTEIEEHLGKVVDGFASISFNRVEADRIGFNVVFTDARGSVPAANLSDGTLSFIGLVTLLTAPTVASVTCLEEPENGLTPRATRAIYELIRMQVADGSQIILSSHSPYVLCESWNGDTRDFVYQLRLDSGTTRVTPLNELIATHAIPLSKDKSGAREVLNLFNAEQLMDGYFSQPGTADH